MLNPTKKSRKWPLLLGLLIVLLLLGGFIAWRTDWSAYRSTADLIAQLENDPHSTTAVRAQQQLSGRLRAARISIEEAEKLVDVALAEYPRFPRSPGLVDWPANCLRDLHRYNWLRPQQTHSYLTFLIERELRAGLSSEGLSRPTEARLTIRFPVSNAILAEVRVVPGLPALETDRPIYRVGLGMTNLHAFCLLSFPSDMKDFPPNISLAAEMTLRGESGTPLWEGTVHYENLPWPRRGLATVDTRLSRPARLEARPLSDDGPK